jgi:hypothetical protein
LASISRGLIFTVVAAIKAQTDTTKEFFCPRELFKLAENMATK